MVISVIKRDGTREAFEPAKLTRVLKAAWCDDPRAAELTELISQRIQDLGEKVIKSTTIRDIVLEELKKADKQAYNFYRWYQDTQRNLCPPPT
jgi:transcriptional repressor NrdR